jgi:predicted esterase
MRRCLALIFVACVGCRESSAAQETLSTVAAESTASASTTISTARPNPVPPSSVMAVPTATLVSTTPVLDSFKTDWCIDGIPALDEETCVVLPAKHDGTLLVYLHGIVPSKYPDSEHKTKVETIVKNAAERGGVVAMIPRGVAGIGPKNFESWYAWPTTGTDYAKYARAMVKGWLERRQKLEKLLGAPFARTYLAGSSSGAYFVSALALHGDAPFDGFGAMSGGAGWVSPELPRVPPRPLYIGYGTADNVGGAARVLGETVKSHGWPVHVAEHPFGHGAREIYIDEALAFWRSTPPR